MTLGPNSTNATVVIKASNAPFDILVNGDFNGPNPWLFVPGAVLTSATILPNHAGRTGVLNVSGTSPAGTTDTAFVYQTIQWPSFPILSGLASIDYCIDLTPTGFFGIYLLTIGYALVDVNTNVVVDSNTVTFASTGQTCTPASWTLQTFGVNVAALTPGNQYFYVLFFRIQRIFGAGYSVSFYVDSTSLVLTPNQPVFQGIALYANVSIGTYNSSMSLVGFTFVGNADLNITLKNNTASQLSTPIVIDNSVLISGSTSELIATTVPPGYYSLEIHVSSLVDPGGRISAILNFIYRVGQGVYVYYPVNITVVDPPSRGEAAQDPPLRTYKLVVDYNSGLSNVIGGLFEGG